MGSFEGHHLRDGRSFVLVFELQAELIERFHTVV
jgi:hypothetical protein